MVKERDFDAEENLNKYIDIASNLVFMSFGQYGPFQVLLMVSLKDYH